MVWYAPFGRSVQLTYIDVLLNLLYDKLVESSRAISKKI